MKQYCFVGMMMLCSITKLHAQDTVRITLPEAEKQFLQANLQILAEKYNIDIAQAEIIQAKLYDNPVLTLTGNAYDPQRKKVFNVSNKSGQYDIAVQQLVRLAGKRNKEIKLAEINSTMSESAFYDLLRTLRYSLRSTFYDIFYLQHSVNSYQLQIDAIEKLSVAYDQLQLKSVVTLKDAVRIKALLYNLKAEQSSLQNQVNELEASLQMLLQNNDAYFISVVAVDNISSEQIAATNIRALVDTAYTNRPDLQLAQRSVLYNQQNYTLQKALAKPDLTFGGEFDKRGSFVDNATFLSVSMDLPFFKRNQGNIKAAKFSVEQSKVMVQQQGQSVENDVKRAWAKVQNTDKMLSSIDPDFAGQFEKLLQGVTENFQKKNISLVEFTDFYESYKNNVIQVNQLRDAKMQAIEALHFAIGKTIFNN